MLKTKPLLLALLIAAAAATVGCSVLRPDHAIQVASGMTSHLLCSETFVSGLDPDRAYAETLRVQGGFGMVDPLLHYQVDRERKQVTTTVAGMFESRAVYREGWGCRLLDSTTEDRSPFPADVAAQRTQATSDILAPAPATPVAPSDPRLRAALDEAFAESPQEPFHLTKAVVVVHGNRIIAERYAPGYGVDTPLHGWSATKSAVNAMVGVLVQQGRMSLQDHALVPAWRDPSDPRSAITIEELLRQTSGLALEQTNSGLDPSSIMKFVEGDMAAYAQKAALDHPPGTHWAYADGNYVLLGRILRDRVGGTADAFARFAYRDLFDPLGMRNVTFETDAAGTPFGSAFMLATARDWARLGVLYLQDGVVNGRRLLPEGWVRWSATPTLDTGYGVGFFTNLKSGGEISNWGTPWEMPQAPKDTFYARGYMGQLVVIVPSQQLVIVRMGPSHVGDDGVGDAGRLVAQVSAALQASSSSH